MTLQGLPDFSDSPIAGVFGPYEGRGQHHAVPDQLLVASLPDGTPDIRLQLYRPATPDGRPDPYGVLDLGLRMAVPFDDALADLRGLRPGAVLVPAQPARGFARLRPIHAIDGTTADLAAPAPVAWTGVDTGRWSIRFALGDAIVLRDALRTGVVPAVASATFEIAGVGPRVGAVAAFDPGRLLPLLASITGPDGATTRPALVAFFAGGGPGSPGAAAPVVELTGSAVDPDVVASVLADWVRTRYGSLTPDVGDDGEPVLRLAIPTPPGTGRMQWDLRSPTETFRPFTASFSPLVAAVEAIAHGREERVIPPVVVVPELFTGEVEIAIRANLPRPRAGLLDLSVTLTAPPNPPVRPQAAIESWQPGDDRDDGVVRLRFAPTETVRYLSQTLVVLDDPVDPGPFTGPSAEHDDLWVDLGVEDFGVRFVPLSAEPALLAIARLRVRVHWMQGDVERERTVVLDDAHPELAVALPWTVDAPTIDVQAEHVASGGTLHVGPFPLGRLHLGLHSFAEYGPQLVEITARFSLVAGAGATLVLDLLPESTADEADATRVALTKLSPTRTWRYQATSPFTAGYRYRHRKAGATSAWSPRMRPGEPLVLDGDAMATGVGPGGHDEVPA